MTATDLRGLGSATPVPPLAARPSWQECHDADMTLREAAAARVTTTKPGRDWANRRGLVWRGSRVRVVPQPGVVRRVTPAERQEIEARMRAGGAVRRALAP